MGLLLTYIYLQRQMLCHAAICILCGYVYISHSQYWFAICALCRVTCLFAVFGWFSSCQEMTSLMYVSDLWLEFVG